MKLKSLLLALTVVCGAGLPARAEDATALYQQGVMQQGYAAYSPTPAEHKQHLDQAKALFRQALEVKPDYFDAHIHLAAVQSELGEFSDSLKNLEEALALPGVSEMDKTRTQQAIAYVKTRLGSPATPAVVVPQPQQQQTFNNTIAWTRFVDPTEHAFSIDVPAGWAVEGGMTRVSVNDVRPWVRTVSPDKTMCAFAGDGAVSPSTMPTATLYRSGFGIGSKYMNGLVLPYMPARKFVEKYALLKLKPLMPDVQVVQDGDHPDIARMVNGTTMCNAGSHCASIKLTGTLNGVPCVAYYIAATRANVIAGSGMWWVTLLAGELTPAQYEVPGMAILMHMLQSFQTDQKWFYDSQAATASASADYRAHANAISNSIVNNYWSQQQFNERMNSSYWNQQAVQGKAAENFSDHMRDQETIINGDGQPIKIQRLPW